MKSEKKMLSDHSLFSRRRLGPPIGNREFDQHCKMMRKGSQALLEAIARVYA
ncbi:hypothetical protein ACQKOE_13955 [Novosphingobium sp. NPDC080210]|uniref:hypothetical protein n=1 Tax=Novosphingobium sp. NPDC080210 TaxID=3390596 RepID=UPI003D01A174